MSAADRSSTTGPGHRDATIHDVAIVGYGPVGALLANLLGGLGRSVCVLERAPSVYHQPRAAHFDGEVMRLFQAAGVADAILPCTTPLRGMHFVDAAGVKLFGFDSPPGVGPQAWANDYAFYQPDLETALRAGVDRFPSVQVELETEVDSVTDRGDHVEVRARHLPSGQTRVVRARYAVGCEGGRSLTRRAMGSTLEDLAFDQPWLVVDVLLKRPVDLPGVCLQICDPLRPSTFVPMAGRHRRWEFMLLPGETAAELERPERVAELLARWVPLADVEVIRAVVYTFHAVLGRGWRSGRLLLAGDAAHQMPPFLGQGMCSGIRDAANLAWKLDLVLRGVASESLLDTYEPERSPHVRRIVELAVFLGGIIQATTPDKIAQREALVSSGGLPDPGDGMVFPLGPGLSPEARLPVGTPAPQALWPGDRRSDDLGGFRFQILRTGGDRSGPPAGPHRSGAATGSDRSGSAAGPESLALPPSARTLLAALDARVIDVSGSSVADWMSRHEARFAVVRPDRILHALCGDEAALAESVSGLRRFVAS